MSIIIKNLNKIYPNGNHALKDINLEIPAGMFGLLGTQWRRQIYFDAYSSSPSWNQLPGK